MLAAHYKHHKQDRDNGLFKTCLQPPKLKDESKNLWTRTECISKQAVLDTGKDIHTFGFLMSPPRQKMKMSLYEATWWPFLVRMLIALQCCYLQHLILSSSFVISWGYSLYPWGREWSVLRKNAYRLRRWLIVSTHLLRKAECYSQPNFFCFLTQIRLAALNKIVLTDWVVSGCSSPPCTSPSLTHTENLPLLSAYIRTCRGKNFATALW